MPITGALPPLPSVVPPDGAALLTRTAARLASAELRRIAEADRGHDAEEHYRALCEVAAGRMPSPLQWCPREALALTRWDEPKPPCGRLGFQLAHQRRAFCCAALLSAAGDPANPELGEGANTTLFQLIGSLEALSNRFGIDFEREAAALLAWLIPRIDRWGEERPFLGLGLLWFALGRSGEASDGALLEMAEWVMAAEDAVNGRWRESLGVGATGPWLLSKRDSMFRRRWQAFGERLAARPLRRHGAAVWEAVGLMAAALAQ